LKIIIIVVFVFVEKNIKIKGIRIIIKIIVAIMKIIKKNNQKK